MPALTLNPGFVPMLAALLMLATPRALRAPTIVGAALLALWLLLDREFGAAAAVAQVGLDVVPLQLDALNRIFGIALLIALVTVGLYSSERRNRFEDAAILLLAGSATSALFVGDIVLFVALIALAGLAAAWVVLASPIEGANTAGVRLLIWHGIEGLLLLSGAALHLAAEAGDATFARLDTTSLGGVFIFVALMIRAGAPFAHVWLKDSVSHASPAGGAALSCFTTMLGVYALARLFPAEPILIGIGAVMIGLGLFFAIAEDDLRRAAAYGLMAQTGACLALIGIGSPLALAAAEAHAFAVILAFLALQAALGAVLERAGSVRISRLTGLARRMPISAFLIFVAGLAVAGAPGFAVYATHVVALEAASQWELRWLWAMLYALPPLLLLALALRPALTSYSAAPARERIQEAPFAMLLGAGLALFLSLSVGLVPRWLYALMPGNLLFQPFALDRLAPTLQALGAATLVYLLLRSVGAAPRAKPRDLLDVDAFYRGPMADAGRWAGILALRLYGAWQVWTERTSLVVRRRAGILARACDRPYAVGAANAAQLVAIAALLAVLLWVG